MNNLISIENQIKTNSIELFIIIWKNLKKIRRKQVFYLLLISLISGITEMLSIASILPFLEIMSNPTTQLNNNFINLVFEILEIKNQEIIVIIITISFILIVLFSTIIRLFTLWFNAFLTARIGNDISTDSYRKILYQSYFYHIDNNTSNIISTITTQIDHTVASVGLALKFLTNSIIVFCIAIGLIIIDWQLAIVSGSLVLLPYILIGWITKKIILKNSSFINKALKKQMRSIQESLGLIKEVLIDNNQKHYTENYLSNDKKMRIKQSENLFLSNFPRFAMEGFGIIGLALVASIVSLTRNNTTNLIPYLGTLTIGAQRIVPILQQIYSGLARFRGYSASIYSVINILNLPIDKVLIQEKKRPLPFKKSFTLENIYFYFSKEKSILKDINLRVNKGEKIGIIGTTGSGKSTLLNIILGLLNPNKGKLKIDELDIFDKRNKYFINSWRQKISHVPQKIYLTDGTIAENIALGQKKEDIDLEKVKKVAKIAQAMEFIKSRREGLFSIVGEKGIKLSVGQCQRIGVARALYKGSSVLILDEATSALDINTERLLMESLQGLQEDITLIIVAHRLSTLSFCDRIIELKNGSILKTHTPKTLGLKKKIEDMRK